MKPGVRSKDRGAFWNTDSAESPPPELGLGGFSLIPGSTSRMMRLRGRALLSMMITAQDELGSGGRVLNLF